MGLAFASGLAQGFASEFVPEFKSFLKGRKAMQGVNQAADALGSYYKDPALGEMFKTIGQSALEGGADPAQVTSALFQQGLSIQKEKARYNMGLASDQNKFTNAAGLKILQGKIDSEGRTQSSAQQQALAGIYAQGQAQSDGRRLFETIYTQGQQNTRATQESGVRAQKNDIDAKKAGVGSIAPRAVLGAQGGAGSKGQPLELLLN